MRYRRKKISILIPIRHPVGGIRTYLKYTYGKLDFSKYELTLVFPKDYKEEEDTLAISRDLSHHLPNVVIANGRNVLSSLFKTLFSLLGSKRFDIVHSQGATCGILVSLANLLSRIPHIVTLHETFDEASLGRRLRGPKRELITFLLARADVINVVSEDARNNLQEVFPRLKSKRGKIRVIPHGIDVDYFQEFIPNMRRVKDVPGISQKDFIIGYLGRYMPEKGFCVLIDAVKILTQECSTKSIKVLCLGWGAFIREYQQYIREKGLDDYFVFIDFQNDVRWILRGIHLLVVPSLREAAGLVAMEALVSGTPIVASNCIGLREVLRGTPAKMSIPGDPADLAEKIKEVIDNYPHTKREFFDFMSKAARRFDCKNSATQLFEIVSELGSAINTYTCESKLA